MMRIPRIDYGDVEPVDVLLQREIPIDGEEDLELMLQQFMATDVANINTRAVRLNVPLVVIK